MKEQFLRNKILILHYYIVATIVGIFFGWWVKREGTMDQEINTVLAIYLLIFPVVILYTRKYAVHIFLFVLAFITGFYSYYFYSVEDHSVLNALYFTFQLYLLDMTDVFTQDGSTLVRYPLIVEIARWSAALYTISTLFIAMYRMLEMSIILSFYQFVGNHTVVFGYNENSLSFIKNLRQQKRRVILVADQVPREVVDYLEELKVVVIRCRGDETNLYAKCGMARAKNIVLLHKKDMDNLDELMGIHYRFKKHSRKNEKLTVYVHLHVNESRKLFLDLKQTNPDLEQDFSIQLFNLYELFVDNLFSKHPIYKAHPKKTPLYILIIGFGPLGQRIAKKALTQSEQFGNKMPYIIALDKAMPKIEQAWTRNYPEIADSRAVALHPFDATSDSIETVIQQQDKLITHIYVCLPEEHLDLWAAIELSNQFPHIPIYLQCARKYR